MDSLIDYILWMSDIPVKVTGFRDADALVLNNLAYINMTRVFEEKKDVVYLRDCRKLIEEGKVEAEIAIKDDKYTELLRAAVDSKRFGDLRISNYIDVKSTEPPVQFAVVCFHDDEEKLSFIAFRGTDDTIAGWHEDFIICYSVTEAQKMAKGYVENVIANDPERRWMMGGHSKGGNLALYAGTTMNRELFAHVERIYDLDGPGLCLGVMGWPSVDRVLAKTTRIIPEFSVVGRMFDMNIPDTKIVRSSAKGILQHAPITWGIEHGRIAVCEKNSPVSAWFNEFFANWTACSGIEERKIFLDEVFEAISAGGAVTLEDITSQGIEGFKGIQLRLKNASDVTKRVMYDFTKQAFFSSIFPGVGGNTKHLK
ncbi:MAG: DUF2974 domain-containing protein [Lachnospiraceae bacterium]|nr:DUF2974 domain-containing protein [Lachnospiraceae bacterium]